MNGGICHMSFRKVKPNTISKYELFILYGKDSLRVVIMLTFYQINAYGKVSFIECLNNCMY